MNNTETWELLQRVGCLRPAHVQLAEGHADVVLGNPDVLADPVATEQLGRRLADALPGPTPDLVLLWGGFPSLVIGFSVGVALGRPVVRLTDDEGLLDGSGPINPGQKAVLVGITLTDRDINLAKAFLGWSHAELAHLATLVDDGREGDNIVSLVSLRDHIFSEETCPLCKQGAPLEESGVLRE